MKRLITFCLTLVLALSLCVPASAVEKPNWDGPLGKEAGPHLCKTGKDYILYYDQGTDMFYSTDGVVWTAMPPYQWVNDAFWYSPTLERPIGASKEFQFLWTGTEYMMRQSLLDSPKEVNRICGDSPRNNMVTFLDTDWNILGVKAFDAPVTAIRAQDGVYYATVDGTEHSFSRSEWDSGPFVDENGAPLGTFYIGRHRDGAYLIRQRRGDNSPFSLSISWDGRSWVPLETYMTPDMMCLAETGGAVVYYCTYTGEIYYYQISGSQYTRYSGGWAKAGLGFDPVENISTPHIRYTFRWTGNGYLMCQSAGVRGLTASLHEDVIGAWDTYVSFLDEEFHRTGAHDFGAPVTGVAWSEGVYYAEVTEPGGEPVIYQSQDGETWTVSPMTALPSLEPVSPDAFPDWPGREYLLSPLTPRVYQPQVKPHKEIPTWSISRPNGF